MHIRLLLAALDCHIRHDLNIERWENTTMSENERAQIQAVRTLCSAIFGPNNLSATDFADVRAWQIARRFSQDNNGVMIQFCVSNHALGKVTNEDVKAALGVLLTSYDNPAV